MKVAVRRTNNGYIPQDEYNENLSNKHKEGECYLADFRMQRNPGFHRLFFFGLNVAFENIPEDFQKQKKIYDINRLRKMLMFATGRTETVWNPKLNEFVEYPLSIAFDEMDEFEFRDLVKDCGYTFVKLFGWNPWEKDDRIMLKKRKRNAD